MSRGVCNIVEIKSDKSNATINSNVSFLAQNEMMKKRDFTIYLKFITVYCIAI